MNMLWCKSANQSQKQQQRILTRCRRNRFFCVCGPVCATAHGDKNLTFWSNVHWSEYLMNIELLGHNGLCCVMLCYVWTNKEEASSRRPLFRSWSTKVTASCCGAASQMASWRRKIIIIKKEVKSLVTNVSFKGTMTPSIFFKIVAKWIKDNKVLEWPSQSPDLNRKPIENLKEELKKNVQTRTCFHLAWLVCGQLLLRKM